MTSEVEDGKLLAVHSNEGPHIVLLIRLGVDIASAIIGGITIDYQRSPVGSLPEPPKLKKTIRVGIAVFVSANYTTVYSHQSIGSNLLGGEETRASTRNS